MVIVDYVPGGLGHFIAQILTDSIATNGGVAFHQTQGNYGVELMCPAELFAKQAPTWIPSNSVNICHSWGQLDLVSYRPIEKWQVHIDKQYLYLFYNFYLKAYFTFNQLPKDHWLKKSKQNDTIINNQREWAKGFIYNMHHTWPTKPNLVADRLIRFDDFYDSKQSFLNVVYGINPALSLTSNELWSIWTTSQQPIFEAVDRIKSKCNLSEIDLGVLDYLNSN